MSIGGQRRPTPDSSGSGAAASDVAGARIRTTHPHMARLMPSRRVWDTLHWHTSPIPHRARLACERTNSGGESSASYRSGVRPAAPPRRANESRPPHQSMHGAVRRDMAQQRPSSTGASRSGRPNGGYARTLPTSAGQAADAPRSRRRTRASHRQERGRPPASRPPASSPPQLMLITGSLWTTWV